MRLRLGLDGEDISNACLIDALNVRQDSTEAISTCDLAVIQQYGISRYDTAQYSRAAFVYEWSAREWAQVILWDEDTTQILFAGYILSVQRRQEGPHVRYELGCSDWGIVFERRLITQSWPAGTLDSTIIADVLATVPEIAAGTIVTLVADVGAIDVAFARCRDVLDQVCELTGGEWNVSYDGKLNYYKSGSIVAPFGLSDQPDFVTSYPYVLEDYATDFSDAANRVQVLGAISDAGEVRALAEHGASQATYGVLSVTLVDRNITDQQTASVWAESEVAVRAYPKPTIAVSLFYPGLMRGMTVEAESIKYGASFALIVRTLTVSIAAPDRKRAGEPGHVLKYGATLGWRPPDLVYSLRRMQRKPVERTFPPPPPPDPVVIGPPNFAEGIAPVYLVPSKPTNWAQYPADAVFLNTTDRKLYRRTGDNWTTVVNTSDIEGQIDTPLLAPGSVTSVVLADGAVINAKIPAGQIDERTLSAGAVTTNILAANAVTALKINSDAIESRHLTANSVVAGKIAALAVLVGNIAADAVTAGTIAAGAIRAQDAVFELAAIQSADIKELRGEKIVANTITSDKLSAIELSVGYGGNKPGRIAVYDTSFSMVALMGDLSGAGVFGYGMWAKMGGFGGTNYGTAKVYTDVPGNLFIRDANLTITASDALSRIETSPATFDATYGSIALNVIKPGDSQMSLVSRGLVVKNSSGTTLGAFVRSPTTTVTSELTINNGGTLAIWLNGNDGRIRVSGGYDVTGYAGQTQSVTISGTTLNFRGGLFVGVG